MLDNKFDGDKGTGNGLMLEESVRESKEIMNSRAFHVKTDGSIAHSLSTDTVNFLLGAMTGTPVITPEVQAKWDQLYVGKQQATESLDELSTPEQTPAPSNAVFVFEGKSYSMNKIMEIIPTMKIKAIPMAKVQWLLDIAPIDEARLEEVEVTDPIIAVPYKAGVMRVISGLDIAVKARDQGMAYVPGYVITQSQLESTLVA